MQSLDEMQCDVDSFIIFVSVVPVDASVVKLDAEITIGRAKLESIGNLSAKISAASVDILSSQVNTTA
jgi:hypothetical protein